MLCIQQLITVSALHTQSDMNFLVFWRNLLPLSFSLKMETTSSFIMLVNVYQTTWNHFLEENILPSHCYENLKAHTECILVCNWAAVAS